MSANAQGDEIHAQRGGKSDGSERGNDMHVKPPKSAYDESLEEFSKNEGW